MIMICVLFQDTRQRICVSTAVTTHVETVVLLSKGAEQSGTENGRQQKSEGGLLSGGYGFI